MQKIIDDLKKTFATTAQKAVKKSGELFERSKITLAITAVQNDIDHEYQEIGRLVYNGYKDDEVSTESVTQRCQVIDQKMAEIDELRAKLAEIKNVRTCTMCGAEVTSSSSYCAKCGEKL